MGQPELGFLMLQSDRNLVPIVRDLIWESTRKELGRVSDVAPGIIRLETVLRGQFRCKLQVRVMCSQGEVVSSHREAVVQPEGEMGLDEVEEHRAERQEDGDVPDVITSTFFIHNVQCVALIDIGSTHSYVAWTVSGTLGIQFELVDREMSVVSPLEQSVIVNKLFRDVPLEVQGVIFPADLMKLPFGEFDLILGMDWLVKHRASLDCAAKHMVLKSSEEEEVIVRGAKRLFIQCNLSIKGQEVGSQRTVKKFPDVFPEELPGLPPNCEVEFGIELLPRTTPVSITPYKMAPKELVELKAKIQELLDRGFI
ncbi:DNA/RNA polymerases superfamily protein [Gossypium australe]|uniref:DNA/RNA polymerases superfamily protein n=1 Tax=Gossypium australe TaxID=47621 RepID=A0A5B6W9L7_9ROSI|nr:DNA/RNA polymerases superfamily protein [Gossypium australe]